MKLPNIRLLFGSGVLLVLLVLAIFGPWIAPHDPMAQSLLDQLLPPFWSAQNDPNHWLGTDNLGRDLLSRLIHGARPALVVMLIGATLSGLVGVVLGLIAGYYGGWFDTIISRIIEIFMSFPPMLLAIVLAAVIGPGLSTVVLAIILIGWTRFCRVIRAEVMAMRELEFVASARTLGMRNLRIIGKEILPNLLPMLVVLFSLEMGRAVVVEALLSFIGFSSTDIATWGSIIADGRNYINQGWFAVFLPIVAIIVTVLGLNAFGDGLRQSIDPVMQR
ncbi:ABC transporter permease [Variovorax sp. VNK109]|uniref:ABC transporter permease n=1 Tax=Variovorax sp. VNK109 TaxID=3400919 RepID=UPI003C121F3E